MNRRSFVRQTGLAAVGGVLGTACTAQGRADAPAGRSLERVGLQLYTVREQMAESVPNTLAQVAEIGYTEVEFAGYFDHSPAEIQGFLKEYGLSAPATHIAMEMLRANPVRTIEMVAEIGHEYLVVPFINPPERTADGYRRIADEFNGWARRCQAAGLVFAYHNHDFEFERIDGELAYDLLLTSCDADLVKMEVDLFWIRKGGMDPLPYFARYPGRFPLCHVKDMDRLENMVAVGDGVIDFGQIFAQSEQAGLKHYFVEHDSPEDPFASIERSYRYLSTLTFGS